MTGSRTTQRARRRRPTPPLHPLEYAVACQGAINMATRERNTALLAAADAGWTMRAIAKAVGLSPSTVCRLILEAETTG